MQNHELASRFINVSMKFPASVTAQAAAMVEALEHDARNLNEFRYLHKDRDSIRKIIQAGEHAHRRSNRLSTHMPKTIYTFKAEHIVEQVADLAFRMRELTDSDIAGILRLYGTIRKERTYRNKVEEQYLRR